MARRQTIADILVLNYKFRLHPTPEQERILGGTMMFAWANWARMVRFTRQSGAARNAGRAADIHRQLADMLLGKELTGRRVEKVRKVATEESVRRSGVSTATL